ncbi:hypothetical protein niasHT_035205 [Heterodera trifolii]|uniref:Peptidase S1 domain-containing protein n=1 Tax=Heterodera trifolii TaxID=157864 RepID=A0ABD2IAZ2_9BILA
MFAKFLLLLFVCIIGKKFSLCEQILSPPTEDYSECGISNFDPFKERSAEDTEISHVVKGYTVDDDRALPWMATLQIQNDKAHEASNETEYEPFCTASIIGPRHILTAMHCVADGTPLIVTYGAAQSSKQRHTIRIKSVKFKENAISVVLKDTFTNEDIVHIAKPDLAIIETEEPIIFSSTVRPICLFGIGHSNSKLSFSNKFTDAAKTLPNLQPFVVAGWGITKPWCSSGIHSTSDQLMYGTMRMISMKDCTEAVENSFGLRNDDDGYDQLSAILKEIIEIDMEDKICVVPEPSQSNSGDSGSPLLSKIGENNWIQIGVLNAGTCNLKHPFSLKDNIATYAPIDCDWIARATNDEVKCKGW